MNKGWMALLVAASVIGGGVAYAQSPAAKASPNVTKAHAPAGKAAAGDLKFATEAAQGGKAEVVLGALAVKKAKSAEVKQFGQRMVHDHSAANGKLQALAQRKGWKLPNTLPKDAEASLARLNKLSGEAFDRAYMTDMVKDHEHDAAAFKAAIPTLKDKDLKGWAQQTLPTVQDHLKMARQMAAREKSPAHMKATSGKK